MAEKQKVAEADLKVFREFRESYVDVVNQLGQLEVQRISIEKAKESVARRLEELAVRENEIVSEFEVNYGIGEVNLETGEFIPQDE